MSTMQPVRRVGFPALIGLFLCSVFIWSGKSQAGDPTSQWIHCSGGSCPEDCSCNSTAAGCIDVHCIALGDRSVFKDMVLPKNTTTMTILGCNLGDLPAYFISNCSELQVVNIFGNAMRTIHPDAFKGLTTSVRNMSLSDNQLNWSEASLPKHLFDSLTHIVDLDLVGMEYDTPITSKTYRDDLFENLHNLARLFVDGIHGASFGPGYSSLESLKFLQINDGLSSVDAETFAAFQNVPLETLQLFSKDLNKLDGLGLSHFMSLKYIYVYFAQLSLTDIGTAVAKIGASSQLEALRIEATSDPHGPFLIIVEEFFFKILERFPLRDLRLSNCRISYLPPGFAQYMPNLETIDVSGNRLDLYSSGMLIEILERMNLTKVLASKQDLAVIKIHVGDRASRFSHPGDEHGFRGIQLLNEHVDGHSHRLSSFGGRHSWRDRKGQAATDLSPVMSKSAQTVRFPDTLLLPPRLQVLDLEDSLQKASIPSFAISGSSELRLIDFSYNGVEEFRGQITLPRGLKPGQLTVQLVSNWGVISEDVFNDAQAIGKLYLGYNRLGGQLAKDMEGSFLRGARYLTELGLEENQIRSLPKGVFKYQRELHILQLTRNYLERVNFDIEHMVYLQKLDLSYNQLTMIASEFTSQLDLLYDKTNRKTKTLSVSLEYNPIVCSCGTLPFLKWLTFTKVAVQLPSKCLFGGEHSFLTFEILRSKIIPELTLTCGYRGIFVAAVASCSVTIVVLVLSTCVYRHRWDIKFCCLKFVIDRKKYMEDEDTVEYEYDAFVAYQADDLPWVRNELLVNMEDIPGPRFKLCIHQRDFLPGKPISQSIAEMMPKCRKVILVLTGNFAHSAWCEFETQLAITRCMDEGRDVIVPILMEELPARDTTKLVANVLRRNTYIEWPNSINERERFWEKMKQTLRSNKAAHVQFARCECGKTVEI